MNMRVIIRVEGKVQGVFFRMAAKEAAEREGVAGTVRNEPDGSVTVDVEGEEGAVGRMVAWCGQGSPYAEVAAVRTSEAEPLGRRVFVVE